MDKYAAKKCEKYREYVNPFLQDLTTLRYLVADDLTTEHPEVDQDATLGQIMNWIVDNQLSTHVIRIEDEPSSVYLAICENCGKRSEERDDNNRVSNYVCRYCGTCLVVDDPCEVLCGDEAVEMCERINNINRGEGGNS